MGDGDYEASDGNGKHTRNYTLFKGMMARSYNKDYQERNPSYIGYSIEESWHCFQNFCEDIPFLEGYDKWLVMQGEGPDSYELDKDIKVKGNKVYSKDTCMFVSRRENNKSGNKTHPKRLTRLTYKATRLEDGHTEIFTNQAEFADKYKLQRAKVNCCIKGTRKTHKGWKFEILE
jgi:hypothetical protein